MTEEEQSALVARKVAKHDLNPIEFLVEGDKHFIYHMPISEIDRQAQDRWEEFTQVKYEMLKRTHTHRAPWAVIRSDNKHRARLTAIKVILHSVEFEKLNPDLDFQPDPAIALSGAREIELMDAELIRTGRRTF